MNTKLLVLIMLSIASILGLVSMGIPEPTTLTVTSTQAVTFTGSQSSTLTVPQASVITAVSYPRTEVGEIWLYYTTLCNYNYYNQPPTTICATATTYTTTAVSPYTYVNFIVTSFTTTENYATNNSAYSEAMPPPAVVISAAWATMTYSPELSTSTPVTSSTVTSSLTQTSEITTQMTPIFTGGVYEAIAIVLVVVLAISLLIIPRIRHTKN
jgi:type IV secretory pathway VirB2 component (pilin)